MSVARGASALGRSVLAPLVAGVCTAALVAGCTSSAKPSPLPAPTASTPASPSPSATPPTLPPEAEGTSPRAAKAFARHYFDLINYAARTGETNGLRKLSAQDCVSCDAIANNIEKIYNAGGHIESDGWKLEQVRTLQTRNGESTLTLGVFLEPEVVVTATDHREEHQGRRQPMTMQLIGGSGSFRVARLDLVT